MSKNDLLKNSQYLGYRYKPLCSSEYGMVLYHKFGLFFFNDNEFKRFYKIKHSFKESLKSFTRLGERIFRTEPQCGIVFNDSLFIACRYKIIEINLKTKECVKEYKYRKNYIHTDRLAIINDVPGFDDCIAYGEYFANEKREFVTLFTKKNSDKEFHEAFKFNDGVVRHIHNLIPSKENECVLILTGDEDSESGIWIAKDNFSKVEPLLAGNQQYRSCLGYFDQEKFIFATDIPSRQNGIYSINLITNELTKITDICGSCTTGCQAGEKFLFSSSVESKEPTVRSKRALLKYLFSRKLPDGIKDRYSRLYFGNARVGFSVIDEKKKDGCPAGLARFGRLNCIYCSNKKELYLFPVALKQFDGELYRLPFEDKEI